MNNILERDLQKKTLILSANNISFINEHGNVILDASSNVINVNLGYSQEILIQAMEKQARLISYCHNSFANVEIQRKLADKLLEVSKLQDYKCYFCSSGSETIEFSLRLANLIHKSKRNKCLSFEGSYHGSSLGALSVSGTNQKKFYENILPKNDFLKIPNCNNCLNKKCSDCVFVNEIVKLLSSKEYHSLIIDPMGSNALGFIKYSDKYIKTINCICKETNTILILDEITTSIGRTGEPFAYNHYKNIKPDIICLSKGLGVGYANIGVALVRENIIYDLDYSSTNLLGNTYNGNPIACAVAFEAINIIQNTNIITNIRKSSNTIDAYFNSIRKKRIVSGVFGKGLWYSINFIPNESCNYAQLIKSKCLKKGVHILSSQYCFENKIYSHLSFAPPFIIKKHELLTIINIIEESIYELEVELNGK